MSAAALLAQLRHLALLEPEQLAEVEQSLLSRFPDATALARELLDRDWLTAYQANLLLQGKGAELVLGSYLLLEKLGEGGMGAVFKARHQMLGRIVALKLVRKERLDNPAAVKRFRREIKAAAQLNHPNIVLAFDADEANGNHFFTMEFVPGTDLAQLVKERGPLPVDEACDYIRQAAIGLQHAHAQGMIHRDIKPHNLLLASRDHQGALPPPTLPDGRGSPGVVKILDMGLARMARPAADEASSTLTKEGSVMGSLDYIAPEQAMDSHTVDIRADLYSLGCTFYHLLTGRVPFPGGEALAKLMKHQQQEPEPLEKLRPDVPAGVAAVVRKLMAKRPEDRYQTPAELVSVLASRGRKPPDRTGEATQSTGDRWSRAADPANTVAYEPRKRERARRRSLLLLAGGLGALLLFVAVLGYALYSGRPSPTNPQAGKPPSSPPSSEPPREYTNSIGMKLILIPPGEGMDHAYYLGKYEVTQGEWEQVMGYNPSTFKPGNPKVAGMDTSRFPVEQMSWFDSVEFCNMLSEREGLKPYYHLTVKKRNAGNWIDDADVKLLGGNGYHIPTDAEWTHGCAAGATTKYHFGDNEEELLEYAWFVKNSDGRTHVVGTKKPNGFGLYDMHGNVREWNEEMLTNANTGNPERIIRCGNWSDHAGLSEVSYRYRIGPAAHITSYGLRLARDPSGGASPVAKPPVAPEEQEAKKHQADWAVKLKVPVEAKSPSGIVMVLIPPGPGVDHAYYLGKYEVTQGEWEQVMGSNPSTFQGNNPKVVGMDTSRFPVEMVSWFDSVEFCNKLSEREGLKPYYELTVKKRTGSAIDEAEVKILGGKGYHIPTDAEWEHGCAAGAKTKYHFGDSNKDLLEYAWIDTNSDGRPHSVGEKRPNGFGLYDMHGNVREWNEEMLTNATTGAPERVIRGGSWYILAGYCAVSSRSQNGPAARFHNNGLRLARVPSGETPQVANSRLTPEEMEAKKQQGEWAAKLKVEVESKSKSGIVMVLIPPGEGVDHAYYLGKYEVMQGEWEQVMGNNPSSFKAGKSKIVGMDTSQFPVEMVSWFDSVEFCNKLSEREGLKPYYDLTVKKRTGTGIEEAEVKILGGSGYHIPTRAEWTHGCAAGAKTKYHFGDSDEELLEYAWFNKNSEGRTHVVGRKKPNAFGLYDMHGNVQEWNEEMLTKATTGAPERVNRGGNYGHPAGHGAVSTSHRYGPPACYSIIGLRLARLPLGEATPVVNPPVTPQEKEAKKLQADWAAKLKVEVESKSPSGIVMVLIPPGPGVDHAYYLGKYEVTQGEWEQVMGSNPSTFQGNNPKVVGMDTSRFPVEMVSWFDSVEFCNKLSEREGLKPYYELTVKKRTGSAIDEAEVKTLGGKGYHIPTDAEWEHGCAAGAKTKYHFGDSDEELLGYAWFDKNSDGRTHEVGEKKPNGFGLYDMHGNVREWNEEMLTNATTGAPERVYRGGYWSLTAAYCAVSHRSRSGPTARNNLNGLRLARAASGEAPAGK